MLGGKFKESLIHGAHEAKRKRGQQSRQQPAPEIFAREQKRAEKIRGDHAGKLPERRGGEGFIHSVRRGKKLPAEPGEREPEQPAVDGQRNFSAENQKGTAAREWQEKKFCPMRRPRFVEKFRE